MKKRGFTLIELIVVIAIIALLIGVLVPSIGAIKIKAKALGQKSQLRDIGLGLEIWRNDHDLEYPDSDTGDPAALSTSSGAHRLAEALVGRDLLGFDNGSTWDADIDSATADLYDPTSAISEANRDATRVELNNINVAQMGQITTATGIYLGSEDDTGADINTGQPPAYVFTDVFRSKRAVTSDGVNMKIGTPILYYKANTFSKLWNDTPGDTQVFDYYDNEVMMSFGHVSDQTTVGGGGSLVDHPYYANTILFFENFKNDQYPVVNGNYVPYNRDTYLLISAGPDGLYGTSDDITNANN